MFAKCIFCKIINKEIPNHTIYEDEYSLAFLDIFPHAKGHTVIIPKKHLENLSQMTSDDWSNLSQAIAKCYERINQTLKPDGFNIGINDRPPSGQVVPHVHWHIFPRWQDDGGGSFHTIMKNPGNLSVSKIAEMFKN